MEAVFIIFHSRSDFYLSVEFNIFPTFLTDSLAQSELQRLVSWLVSNF